MTREQILESALLLSEEDRLRLARELLGTVPAGSTECKLDDEFLSEIRRRGEDGTTPVPWEVVRDQARARHA